MEIYDLIELAEDSNNELKRSAMITAIHMMIEGHDSDYFFLLMQFFLDEFQDRKVGRQLCELVTIDSFDSGYRDEQIPRLAKYAANPDWEKSLLLDASFYGDELDSYIAYAQALCRAGAKDEARGILYEGIETFDDPSISTDIIIMVKEHFPVGFLDKYDAK